MTQPFITLTDAGCIYPDGHRALGSITLALNAGQRVGLVGANGAGKTTLLSLMTGLLPADTGTVSVAGVPLSGSGVNAAQRRLGFVFQDPDDQLFMPTVWEDVAFGPRNDRLSEADTAARVHEALTQTGTLHLKERFTWKLSGGEKRAVAIAAVLACHPEFLILDEPTAGLDPRSRRSLIRLLTALPHGCLIASHDMDFILDVCPRTLILKEGGIAADGETTLLMRDQSLLEACGLELPLTYQTSAALCQSEVL